MSFLREPVSLHDIKNVEAFVVNCVQRSGSAPLPHEWEDMIAEGVAMLYKMGNDYDPERNEDGSDTFKFSGYAIRYLPKKLREHWHRSREEHLEKLQPDGKRKWIYHQSALSWDQITTTNTVETVRVIDERTVRHPGNFVNPTPVDASRVRAEREYASAEAFVQSIPGVAVDGDE